MREDYTEGAWFARVCVRLFLGFLAFFALVAFLCGCGSPRQGQTREDIAEKYGAPADTITNADGGTTSTYHEHNVLLYGFGAKLHVVTFDPQGRVVKGE